MKILIFVISLCLMSITSAYAKYKKNPGYEVWASDQSNSVADAGERGVKGSYIWIWDSTDIKTQLGGGADALPLGCGKRKKAKKAGEGPCDLLEVFPQNLEEYDADGQFTGNTLADLEGFGRLHGMLPDPQNRYMTANIFAPSGGYVGVIDTRKKNAVALFRVTGAGNGSTTNRSVHMSLWSEDGDQILIANLNGKLLERIDVKRTRSGKIKKLEFNRAASLSVGTGLGPDISATVFKGRNAHGKKMLGDISGEYSALAFSDLTANDVCKENGCIAGPNGAAGGRPNNVIICPITSDNRFTYVTLGGGGLLVVDSDQTPMQIVGEYGNEVINGAGCGGVQTSNSMWLNAGVSASGAGATQSVFTMYVIDDAQFSSSPLPENTPLPVVAFKDQNNTATGGNLDSTEASNTSGQLPGLTTRRDAHGAATTNDHFYVHNADRIANVVEVFDAVNLSRTTYDLTSADGQGNGTGPCMAASVGDDPNLPLNDPAPDLMEPTPDDKYLMVGLRGPTPVSVTHSAQGSCPGVGIIELTDSGSSGKLVGVLRTTNTVDNAPVSAPGGHAYIGEERSDIHAASVVLKKH